MIVGKQKSLEDIQGMIEGREKVLILGCGTCVAVCFAGGEKEVAILASSLRMADKLTDKNRVYTELTVERQCEWEFLDEIKGELNDVDVVLSLGCGVGVQAIGERFNEIPVRPGLDTLFMGMPQEENIWVEMCSGCGYCILDKTSGICPVTRCAKGLLNGPCGGSENGKCEIDRERDCAWALIIERLDKMGELEMLEEIIEPKDWSYMQKPRKLDSRPLVPE